MATVCHRLRWHVNIFFGKTFQNQTKPQVKPYKKLLSHAARRAIVGVNARIPGRKRSAYTIASKPTTERAYLHAQTRTPAHASAHARAHARTYARTCAHASARPRARVSGEGQITTGGTATQRRAPHFFMRTKLEQRFTVIYDANGGTPTYLSHRLRRCDFDSQNVRILRQKIRRKTQYKPILFG